MTSDIVGMTGLTAEKTINTSIGEILGRMYSGWVVDSEAIKSKIKGKLPDILLTESGLSPVVIETEVSPAQTLEQDAKSRLGLKTTARNEIRTVIAVKIPTSYRKFKNKLLREKLLEGSDLEYAIYDPLKRFPNKGFLTGSIADIAVVAQFGMISAHDIAFGKTKFNEALNTVVSDINALHKSQQTEIAECLKQKPDPQTWRMAAFVLLNAAIFHDYAAKMVNAKKRIELRYGGGVV